MFIEDDSTFGFEESEDLSRSDDDENSLPHLNEGDDLDSQDDDPMLIFNESDFYEDDEE